MGILSWTESYGDEIFMNFNMSRLGRDQAYLNISTTTTTPVYLYGLYKECFECPFTKERQIVKGDDSLQNLVIDTRHPKLWRILTQDPPISPVNSNQDVICNLNPNFGEFGVYDLSISETKCRLDVLKEPVNIYFPILTVTLIYTLLIVFATSFWHVWSIYTKKSERPTTSYVKESEREHQKKRLKSLDTFRGISIVLMIFVNYGCGGYRIFDHAIWNGLQLADVVFPWFMWIMGVCVPIAVVSMNRRGISKRTALKGVLKRSCILFGLGLFLGAGRELDRLRIFGVLQRFGVCYFFAASLFILVSNKHRQSDGKKKNFNIWLDVLALKYQWLVALVLLIAHSLFTFFFSVPDCARGYLGPGGYHEEGQHFGCTGGATGYIDKVILGNHRYQWPTILEIYKSEPFDPEGILGCLTSIVQVIIGSQAGSVVLTYKGHGSRLIRFLIWGVVLVIIGGALSGFSKDGGVIPVNKNLWSVSFVFVTSGLAFLLLALCYYLVDVKTYWSGKPFLFAGMNAIFMYVGHSMTYNNFPIRWVPNHEIGITTHFVSLLENVWATGMWIVIAYYLFRIKFFLSI